MGDRKRGIDLREAPLRYSANSYTNDYVGGSFKIRADLLPLAKGVLIPQYELLERGKEIFSQIEEDYKGSDPLFIPILKGAVRFSQDMFRFSGRIDPEYEFMSASSYGTRLESGEVEVDLRLLSRLMSKLQDRKRDIIIIEDIVDTGKTLSHIVDVLQRMDEVIDSRLELLSKIASASDSQDQIIDLLQMRDEVTYSRKRFKGFRRKGSYTPESVSICALLDKAERRKMENRELPVDYVGFIIQDCWPFGYGLDVWADRSRTLDHICVLKEKYAEKKKLERFFRQLEKKRKKR